MGALCNYNSSWVRFVTTCVKSGINPSINLRRSTVSSTWPIYIAVAVAFIPLTPERREDEYADLSVNVIKEPDSFQGIWKPKLK
jgi:hypothetical protein